MNINYKLLIKPLVDRIENRTLGSKIGIRQAGLDDGAWVYLDPHSTVNFSWEDPYGQRLMDICIQSEINTYVPNVSLEKTTECCTILQGHGIRYDVIESGDMKIARFTEGRSVLYGNPELLASNWGISPLPNEAQSNNSPLELVIELGILGISLIDHRPRELLYLYLEKVFVSYSTGYDAGLTNRFVFGLNFINLLAFKIKFCFASLWILWFIFYFITTVFGCCS